MHAFAASPWRQPWRHIMHPFQAGSNSTRIEHLYRIFERWVKVFLETALQPLHKVLEVAFGSIGVLDDRRELLA
jgi:hypothetical protein